MGTYNYSKKSLKIPKGVIKRRTDKTIPKRKGKRTNNDIQNATLKINDRATRTPLFSAVPDG